LGILIHESIILLGLALGCPINHRPEEKRAMTEVLQSAQPQQVG
jgi:hypothetical protein